MVIVSALLILRLAKSQREIDKIAQARTSRALRTMRNAYKARVGEEGGEVEEDVGGRRTCREGGGGGGGRRGDMRG